MSDNLKNEQNNFKDKMESNSFYSTMEFGSLPLNDSLEIDTSKYFFGLMPYPRVGSTIFSNILNNHPYIYCDKEGQIPIAFYKILSQRRFFNKQFTYANYKNKQFKTSDIVKIFDILVKHKYAARFAGDKGISYYHELDLLKNIFPNSKLFLFIRNPLDAMSSLINQPWFFWGGDSEEELFKILRNYIINDWFNKKDIFDNNVFGIISEKIIDKENFIKIYTKIINIIGADIDRIDLNSLYPYCKYKESIDRYKKDDKILNFLDWIKINYYDEFNLIIEKNSYLPKNCIIL